jgi:hypothetical protein
LALAFCALCAFAALWECGEAVQQQRLLKAKEWSRLSRSPTRAVSSRRAARSSADYYNANGMEVSFHDPFFYVALDTERNEQFWEVSYVIAPAFFSSVALLLGVAAVLCLVVSIFV